LDQNVAGDAFAETAKKILGPKHHLFLTQTSDNRYRSKLPSLTRAHPIFFI